ncbi:MFS transporter [Streptomyces antimycoticus]|uniref:MFS transporter n=1 Tax=Streptomyces antimycoticus TaxID=68175 RepID=UPI0037D530E8
MARLAIVDEPARARAHSAVHSHIVAGYASGIAASCAPPTPAPGTSAPPAKHTTHAGWVVTAYLLSASVATPIAGRLGDMYGKRRVLLIALSLLGTGTLIAALASNLAVLIAGRLVQGTGGAIVPLPIGIVRDELPAEQVGLAVGVNSALLGVGGGLGSVLSGPIVEQLSWHWLFWFPLALIAVAAVGIALGVPESPVRTRGRIDVPGTLLLSVGLVCLLLALSKGSAWGWGSGATLGLFGGAACALLVWGLVETRGSTPLVDMRMLALRGMWTTLLAGLTLRVGMFGSVLLMPQLLELPASTGHGFGKTVSEAGLFLLPATTVMIIFSPLSGLLDRYFGAKPPMVLGVIITAASFVVLAVAHTEVWQVLLSVTLFGIEIGLSSAAMANAIVASVPPTQTGVATGLNTLMRNIGGSIGTAVLAALLSTNAVGHVPTDTAFTITFWTCAGVLALGLLGALMLPRRSTGA